MAQSFSTNATRSNARTAGVAAALVAVVMIAQALLKSILGVLGNLAYSSGYEGFPLGNLFSPFYGGLMSFGTSVLPIVVGVFLAFWLLVPLTADLRVPRVALRALIASAIASAVSLVISVFFSLLGAVANDGPMFGNSFPNVEGFGYSIGQSIFGAVQSVLYTFVNVTPLVILAGFLAWFWVSKGRPAASEL